ncbi:unnamed protein product [Rotaria socialis]|uniref:Reverse transcriptase domain-containing protein n=1 Tax=Rotaria socialis TaxID=392032 RepID=A0A821QZN8_9BILA|nr:unnamed protein product [Rotaria socialis]CAF4832460.1 unnamed protein product [Rotaria socialis]
MENNKLLKHKRRVEVNVANIKIESNTNNLDNTKKFNVIEVNNTGTEIRVSNTIDLKPQYSTVAACELNEKFRNKVNVFAIGIFPDSAIVNENLMIQSSVVNSDCESLLISIINCSNEIIQLKAGTIVAYAQKLVKRDNGELAESGFEWIKKEDTAIKQPIRRVNGELAEKIEDVLKQNHKDGIIRPSNSPWSSCNVPIVKKCGGLRLTVDYRLLNRLTIKDSFPLPSLNDAVYNLHGSKYFSTLDLTRGY